MFVLDTNVVSELRKVHSDRAVRDWAARIPSQSMYLSAITILEIELGILRLERRDSTQSRVLRMWLDENVLPAFEHRILPVDVAVAQCCARLHVPDPRSERDALIAATALVHGMVVATRNISHFQSTGVRTANPWLD